MYPLIPHELVRVNLFGHQNSAKLSIFLKNSKMSIKATFFTSTENLFLTPFSKMLSFGDRLIYFHESNCKGPNIS